MDSIIQEYGYSTVSIPITSEFYINSSSKITLIKSGNIVTATIEYIKATNTVGRFNDVGVIPVGFRPVHSASIKISNSSKRGTPNVMEVIGIDFQPTGTISYYNYVASTDTINVFPVDTITYIAESA